MFKVQSLKTLVLAWALAFSIVADGHAQGAFQNLNFEHPIPPLTPDQSFQVPTSNALPGWTAYQYGAPSSTVTYNALSAGAADVSLHGPGSLEPIIQGQYTVVLQGSTAGTPGSSAIGQVGQIPSSAISLVFWEYVGSDNVSFDGQTLALALLGSTANHNVYGADISAFAGQTGQLLFTAPPNFQDVVDNIQFSVNPIPEPATCALILCGAAVFGVAKRKFKV